jgi:endoribonuclease Dicer
MKSSCGVCNVYKRLQTSFKVPAFPVFTRSGEVTVNVELVCADLRLSSEQLSRLYKFHHFVFCYVLRLEKSPMIFDPDSALWGCLVVPVNG